MIGFKTEELPMFQMQISLNTRRIKNKNKFRIILVTKEEQMMKLQQQWE